MTDHGATVAAVLVDCLRALTVMAVEPDRNADALAILAGFTAAGYAVVEVPEGVTVEHGARLVEHQWSGMCSSCHLYAIDDTP